MARKMHELKIKYEYAKSVFYKEKRFELRKNDRDFKVGDLITFKVIDAEKSIENLCGLFEKDIYIITYVLKNVPQYGLNDNYCILGIERLAMED